MPTPNAEEGRAVGERNWRRIGNLTDDEKSVIRERHFGWEKATPALLADVFLTPVQTIVAVLRTEA
jgi:hypothetical protein